MKIIITLLLSLCQAQVGKTREQESINAENEQIFEQLKKKEKTDWLKHFDKDGKFNRTQYNLSQDELRMIRFGGDREKNLKQIHESIVKIPEKIEKMYRISQEFRDLRVEGMQSLSEQSQVLRSEQEVLFEEYKLKFKNTREKVYNEFINYGLRLKEFLDKKGNSDEKK